MKCEFVYSDRDEDGEVTIHCDHNASVFMLTEHDGPPNHPVTKALCPKHADRWEETVLPGWILRDDLTEDELLELRSVDWVMES